MRLAFLASGRGSNMQSILGACDAGSLQSRPVLLISNNANAGALEIARQAGLETFHLSSKTHPQADQLDLAMTTILDDHQIDLVILAGYMKKIGPEMLRKYSNRILNIHPSLLPEFGGQGMFGMHVHEAVVAAGKHESGATIHLVNQEYDQGRILLQASVQIKPGDDAATVAKRVLEIEHKLYPEALAKIETGELIL